MCDCLSCAPYLLGTWPATQVCALTGNQTSNSLVCRLVFNPLSHTSQGHLHSLYIFATATCFRMLIKPPMIPCTFSSCIYHNCIWKLSVFLTSFQLHRPAFGPRSYAVDQALQTCLSTNRKVT